MRRLRIFVSSTMRDLANERHQVMRRLSAMNFEPVLAEGLLPDGHDSWTRIADEIASCDVVVLILGERYGWIPTTGPFGGDGLSVTELEYREARVRGIPVLPFLKRLDYGTDGMSDDAVKRDAFRDDVARWDGGQFLAEFDLADDLEETVAHTVVSLLTDRYLDGRVPAPPPADKASPPRDQPPPTGDVPLPVDLVSAVRAREVVAFYGAGVSLGSGLPSAVAFADAIVSRTLQLLPDYEPPASGTYLNAVASDLEAIGGRAELERTVERLVAPHWKPEPSIAHRAGGRLFRQIISTNIDDLLERALTELGDFGARVPIDIQSSPPVVRQYRVGETSEPLTDFELIKLHGSLREPASLVLTEHDLSNLGSDRPRILQAIVELLRRKSLLVLGSSLRDPSVVALLHNVGPSLRGWSVLPEVSRAETIRLRAWGLTPIVGTAEGVIAALDREIPG